VLKTFALVCLLVCGFAYASEPPAQPPTKHQITAGSAQEISKQKPPESFWQRTVDNPVNVYTALLTFFTAVLAISTIGLWVETKRTSNVAKTSAEAAKKSADIAERSLVDLEGPMLYPVIDKNHLKSISNKTDIFTIIFNIKNYGRTPALPGRLQYSVSSVTSDHQTGRVSMLLSDAVIESHGTSSPITTEPISFTDAEDVMAGRKVLNLLGSIYYHDMFGNQYEQVFCLIYDSGYKVFIPIGQNARKRIANEQTRKDESSKQ